MTSKTAAASQDTIAFAMIFRAFRVVYCIVVGLIKLPGRLCFLCVGVLKHGSATDNLNSIDNVLHCRMPSSSCVWRDFALQSASKWLRSVSYPLRICSFLQPCNVLLAATENFAASFFTSLVSVYVPLFLKRRFLWLTYGDRPVTSTLCRKANFRQQLLQNDDYDKRRHMKLLKKKMLPVVGIVPGCLVL